MRAIHESSHADAGPTLSKAVVRSADILGIKQSSLARILGISSATASRLCAGKYALSAARTKEWELALLLVRLFRSLDAVLGHGESARQWLNGHNLGLNGRPAELIESAEGMVRVLHYLDAHRGRI